MKTMKAMKAMKAMKNEVFESKARAATAKTSAEPERHPAKRNPRRRAPVRNIWVVAGVYGDGDGAIELVSNAVWYDTVEEAKDRAEQWARDLFNEWIEERPGASKKLDGLPCEFEDVWEKVDNNDPEFMDWGFDPVCEWGVASVRIRVFKVYRGK